MKHSSSMAKVTVPKLKLESLNQISKIQSSIIQPLISPKAQLHSMAQNFYQKRITKISKPDEANCITQDVLGPTYSPVNGQGNKVSDTFMNMMKGY